MREFARAKVNLFLHVLGRRADGRHDLDSLAAFAAAGDVLEAAGAEALALDLAGPFGPVLLGEEAGRPNLVVRAAEALGVAAAFRLEKNLPIASGLGGGSADAAAALRLIARMRGLSASDPVLFDAARALGADVPVCLFSRAAWMGGVGDRLDFAPDMPRAPALLVNPGVAVGTGEVFAALGLTPGEAGPFGPSPPRPARFDALDDLFVFLDGTRNDLQPAAAALAPAVGDALDLLYALEGARIVRMSGSGATCFALFAAEEQAHDAAERARVARPDWWIVATTLS